jgi:hypothetical protein
LIALFTATGNVLTYLHVYARIEIDRTLEITNITIEQKELRMEEKLDTSDSEGIDPGTVLYFIVLAFAVLGLIASTSGIVVSYLTKSDQLGILGASLVWILYGYLGIMIIRRTQTTESTGEKPNRFEILIWHIFFCLLGAITLIGAFCVEIQQENYSQKPPEK